jgi:Response regulator receiver domain.
MAKKILIVDDQFGIRLLLIELFQREGYRLYQADDGKKALEIAEREKPDLVLLDIKIPGMDGVEILRRLKASQPSIRVIVMTAYGELDIIEEVMKLGALTFFAKPFDINELKETVNQLLVE